MFFIETSAKTADNVNQLFEVAVKLSDPNEFPPVVVHYPFLIGESYDSEFVDKDQTALFDLIRAANYLEVKGLLGLLCQKVADMIKDMTSEEVRRMFNIVNDFTPEEEENVRKENAWAFE
ncbi:hypothetical protein Vadar_013537 [Vaccinium darrowii]|uniref:Uncharacterized protein n=1 Tax=Vaccinium darrowii TaxID=229202 RepID=A0ACB7ZBJ1_9ERIC|nr:hypothetical protein Vadar_013537 [Vaccinium darrowii]